MQSEILNQGELDPSLATGGQTAIGRCLLCGFRPLGRHDNHGQRGGRVKWSTGCAKLESFQGPKRSVGHFKQPKFSRKQLKISNSWRKKSLYRVIHLPQDLSWVDLDLGSSPGWWAASVHS